MSIFATQIKKISSLVGITTLGQAAATGSLPVVLASDKNVTTVTPTDFGHASKSSVATLQPDIVMIRDADVLNIATYVPASTVYLDGANAAFDTTPVGIAIPMTGYSGISVGLLNFLGVTVTLTCYLKLTNSSKFAASNNIVFSGNVTNGSTKFLLSSVDTALASPAQYVILKIEPNSDPSTGQLWLDVARR